MMQQPPDDRAVQIALSRWKKPGPGTLGIGNYTSGTANLVQQALDEHRRRDRCRRR